MSTKIQNILPRMILDSRGFPTIEVEIIFLTDSIVNIIEISFISLSAFNCPFVKINGNSL